MKSYKARLHGSESLSPADEPAPATLVPCLECRAGKAPIVVPVERVAQIIEYETSPIPLTRPWIVGAGIHDDRLVMTVGLVADGAAGAPRARHLTKGVLLAAPDAEVSWALEVQKVMVLVQASVIAQRQEPPKNGNLPPWIARARTSDGRSIAWIDVPRMLAALTSPAVR